MSTLTIHFDNPEIKPIVVEDCELGDFSDSYALPSGEGHVDTIVAAMRAQSEGELYTEWDDATDSWVMFNMDDRLFTLWTGDGDNKGRGFSLDPENPLPFMARIEVSEDAENESDESGEEADLSTRDAVFAQLPASGETIEFSLLAATLSSLSAAEVRAGLIALNEEGVADLEYGSGWHRVVVDPNGSATTPSD